MKQEMITITRPPSGALEGGVSGAVFVTESSAGAFVSLTIETSQWAKTYLSADDDPVLAESWDNDEDSAYDSM